MRFITKTWPLLRTFGSPSVITTALLVAVGGGDLVHAQTPERIISYVDTSSMGAQRYVLKVAGKPFYPIEIQVRLDKLRYAWGWNAEARDTIIARAAADGFNTVSIPLHWYEVERRKNDFDWKILDEYLALATRHGLKMELLWFGGNSGGHVQWLGDPRTRPVHLRTPDYVLYSPAPVSTTTKSEFAIRRDMSTYTLDLADSRLRARETFVLSKIMAHIAQWDAMHGSPRTVIGVQLGNEVRGIHGKAFSSDLVVSYISAIGGAVKHSTYDVWTRLNCVYTDLPARLEANQKLRRTKGTNIDFVGIDTYRHHLKSDQDFIASMRTNVPKAVGNYRMIMEVSGEFSNAAALQLSALSGGSALDFYDIIGPDGHGMYDRVGAANFRPHGSYVEDVRLVNHLLSSDLADIALKLPGRDLFVHNAEGRAPASSSGARGVVFTPAISNSRAISILHSADEVILMNTRGGTFRFPTGVRLIGASSGHYEDQNWVREKSVPVRGSVIAPPAGTTVRVILK